MECLISTMDHKGGFGGNVDHDPHLLFTLSAIQILKLFGALDRLDVPVTVECTLCLCSYPELKAHAVHI